MSATSKLIEIPANGHHQRILSFYCPGCKHYHSFHVPRWSFNDNFLSPTFSPSLLNTWPHPEGNRTCHLFVRDGKIIYLHDCWHELAGQTVDMQDEEE